MPKRSLLPLYLIIFVAFAGYSLLVTLFVPLFIVKMTNDPLDTRLLQLTLLLTLYPLGQLIGFPLMISLVNRFQRKHLILCTLFLSGVCYLAMAHALQYMHFSWLFAATLLAGMSESHIFLAQRLIREQVSLPEEQARFMRYLYVSASFAYVAGPLIAGRIFATYLGRGIGVWEGDAGALVAFAGIIGVVWLVILVFFQEPKGIHIKETSKEYLRKLAFLIMRPRLTRPFIINILLLASVFGFFRCYPIYIVEQFHFLAPQEFSYIIWAGLPIVTANITLVKTIKNFHRLRRMTLIAAFVTAILMAAIPLLAQFDDLWGSLILTSIAMAIVLPLGATILVKSVEKEAREPVLAINQFLQTGAEIVSVAIGGTLAVLFSGLPMLVCALFALIAAFVLWRWHP